MFLAMVGMASVAAAHTELTGSDPAEGARVATAPSQLTLTFTEPVDPTKATVRVTANDGTAWQVGTITATDATLTVPVTPAGPAGPYAIDYRIISADGDPVTGAVRFTLTAPVPAATTTPPPTTTETESSAAAAPEQAAADAAEPTEGGVPAWVWLAIGVVVLAAIATGVARNRNRRNTTT
ncbi:copper resistance CopC family protein [Actinophytocola sediminis]